MKSFIWNRKLTVRIESSESLEFDMISGNYPMGFTKTDAYITLGMHHIHSFKANSLKYIESPCIVQLPITIAVSVALLYIHIFINALVLVTAVTPFAK